MNQVDEISSDTVMGIAAMAEFTGIAERKLYHLASHGNLPGAFRMGRTWALLKSVYAAEIRARASKSAARTQVA